MSQEKGPVAGGDRALVMISNGDNPALNHRQEKSQITFDDDAVREASP